MEYLDAKVPGEASAYAKGKEYPEEPAAHSPEYPL